MILELDFGGGVAAHGGALEEAVSAHAFARSYQEQAQQTHRTRVAHLYAFFQVFACNVHVAPMLTPALGDAPAKCGAMPKLCCRDGPFLCALHVRPTAASKAPVFALGLSVLRFAVHRAESRVPTTVGVLKVLQFDR